MRQTTTTTSQTSPISASTMVEDRPHIKALRVRCDLTLTALALTCLGIAAPSTAQTMHIETGGRGQVLIFPYYTVRNGTTSFVSLVNQTIQAKALRVRVREAVGGRPVAELNVFLSPKDVWTAAIVSTADGASIISNDKSCTLPKFRGNTSSIPIPVTFSNAGYLTDALPTLDRAREGYLEVIEMASVPDSTPLGKDVAHVAGVPSCKLVADAGSAPIQITLAAPSGGIVGSMSFINLSDGMSVSYNAIGINGFWKTGPGAAVPTITSVSSAAPDLTSGGNSTITVTDKGKTYVSTFARSIDAVSALFMNSTISSEYGFTGNGIFSTALVLALPTKPYYVHTTSLGPFQRRFEATTSRSCDDMTSTSVDREEFIGVSNENSPFPPSYVPPQSCGVTNVWGFKVLNADESVAGNRAAATAFDSPRMSRFGVIQAQGAYVGVPGREGGHLAISPTNPNGYLAPTSSFVLSRSTTTGELQWAAAAHTYFGLPMIGFALSVSKYNVGTPQQNFGNLNALATQRTIR